MWFAWCFLGSRPYQGKFLICFHLKIMIEKVIHVVEISRKRLCYFYMVFLIQILEMIDIDFLFSINIHFSAVVPSNLAL